MRIFGDFIPFEAIRVLETIKFNFLINLFIFFALLEILEEN